MKNYTFTISENALINLITDYAINIINCDRFYDVYEDGSYMGNPYYHKYYEAKYEAEKWMSVLGISPDSNFVTDIVKKEREKRGEKNEI